MDKQLNLSSLQDFKKRSAEGGETILFPLPSGLVMKIKKPSAKLLMIKGLVDDKFFELGLKAVEKGKKAEQEFGEALVKNMSYLIDRCRRIVLELSVFPKFVLENANEENNELNITDMLEEDLLAFLGILPMAFVTDQTNQLLADVAMKQINPAVSLALDVKESQKKSKGKRKNSKRS